jgi:hypothetical protein
MAASNAEILGDEPFQFYEVQNIKWPLMQIEEWDSAIAFTNAKSQSDLTR